jgi:hypothetical protein
LLEMSESVEEQGAAACSLMWTPTWYIVTCGGDY